jgi:hypothetical protein
MFDEPDSERNAFDFLSERSIIDRTKECKAYFDQFVSVNAMRNKNAKVS